MALTGLFKPYPSCLGQPAKIVTSFLYRDLDYISLGQHSDAVVKVGVIIPFHR